MFATNAKILHIDIDERPGKGITPEKIIGAINKLFSDMIVTTDVGQNQLWTTQMLELDSAKKMLTSGGLGTMGYGLPAAIGAKLGCPEKTVIAICGDGGMQMNTQELATAVVHGLPIIICVINNGYLGNVRQWQEMFFEKRYSCTCLRYRRSCANNCGKENCPPYIPDFVGLAQSYGARGYRVEKEEDIEKTLKYAESNNSQPTVLEFIIDSSINVLPIVPPGNSLSNMIIA